MTLATQRGQGINPRPRNEVLVDGIQDARRIRGRELRHWRSALANREFSPANIWFVGDSMTEGYGVTDDYHKWTWIFRRAIQQMFRVGGAGFIACKHRVTWPYASNPDGKNVWSFTGEFDQVDYGFGIGRRATFLNTAGTATITVDCDRFQIFYTCGATGTMRVEVDSGTPFATLNDVTTAESGGWTFSGRVYDSGTIRRGPHVVKITAQSGLLFVDGINVFDTDATVGVHVFEGGQSGMVAHHFADDGDEGLGVDAYWSDAMWQPATPSATFTDGVGNGTTTFTSATAAFVDNDIGEYLVFENNMTWANKPQYGVAKITARASGTSVTLDRTVGNTTGIRFRINRAQVTDASITDLSTTLTSATAAFTQSDVGRPLKGPAGVPAGTFIRRWNSATSIEMSDAATATASSQTLRIQGRQARHVAPDLLVIEFGFNDMRFGVTPAAYKANIKRIAGQATDRPCQDKAPSVVLLGLWAHSLLLDHIIVDAQITSGLATVISETAQWGPEDVGKTISGTGIPGATTISSVQSSRQITMSANATSTTTTVATVTARAIQERHWLPFRNAMYELAEEMGWTVFDLYSLGGYIGTDPHRLTHDFIHANNRGAAWIADELNQLLTGIPRQASIPEGIFNSKGGLIVAKAADFAEELAPGVEGQALITRAAGDLGAVWERPTSSSRLQQIQAPPTGITIAASNCLGILATGVTVGATASNVVGADGPWLRHTTSTTDNNQSGIITTTFDYTRPGWLPEFNALIKLGSSVASYAVYIGLMSSAPDSGAAHGAWFRYDTDIDGTAFWRAVTRENSTSTEAVTTLAAVASTQYNLRIECVGTQGSTPTSVRFYNNGIRVAENTTNIPTTTRTLGLCVRVITRTTATKFLDWSRIGLSGV